MIEGKLRSRAVVIEFPSYEAALACYRSPEYQAAKALRQGKAEADLVVIEAIDGMQSTWQGVLDRTVEVNDERATSPMRRQRGDLQEVGASSSSRGKYARKARAARATW